MNRFSKCEVVPLVGANGNRMTNAMALRRGREYVLVSYDTVVMSAIEIDGAMSFTRESDMQLSSSSTTVRHVNAFRKYFGLSALTKRQWDDMKKWTNKLKQEGKKMAVKSNGITDMKQIKEVEE